MPLPFGYGPTTAASQIVEKEIAPIARTPLEKVLFPFFAGAGKVSSNVLGSTASIADFASFGNFPKDWSAAIRNSAVEHNNIGQYFSRSNAARSVPGKAVRTGYDLLPFLLYPGAGATAAQATLAGGGAAARNEPVVPAVTQELGETLVRPLKNPMANKILGELTTSEAFNE
jgi:hypothetical protein